jgi:N-acetylglucosaminyl-diphospho-decaprenol L-rhamnosyltransferase
MISISIISHGQFELVKNLLTDLEKYCADQIEVILTLNIPEEFSADLTFSFPLKIIKNIKPKGFGANHNQAFLNISGEYFCVLNPDIRLFNNPFPVLIKNKNGVTAPKIDDNAREFLTPLRLLKRIFKKTPLDTTHPDWVAGMFMVFPKEIYEKVHGFDERYFLYCEDMDICWRLRKLGYSITVERDLNVVHDARRDSHKKLKYLYWHLKSLWIYLTSP